LKDGVRKKATIQEHPNWFIKIGNIILKKGGAKVTLPLHPTLNSSGWYKTLRRSNIAYEEILHNS
jgi:hypothetical protein